MQTVTLLPTYIRSCRHVPHFVVSVGNAQSSCALVWLMDMHVCLCVYTAYMYVRSSYTHTHTVVLILGVLKQASPADLMGFPVHRKMYLIHHI